MTSPSRRYDSQRCAAQRLRELGQRGEHRFQIECRAADDFQHVGGRGLLLQGFAEIVGAFAQFFEQSGVLDGDHGLTGEIGDEFDLFAGEGPHFLSIDRDRADHFVFPEHRHCHKGPCSREIGDGDGGGIALKIGCVRPHIFELDSLLGSGRDAHGALGLRPKGLWRFAECRRHVMERDVAEAVSIIQAHHTEIGAADAGRIFQHLLENGLQVHQSRH